MEEKASILIVDDDTSLCRTMSLVLGRRGYAVDTAEDGLKAIDMVRERPFDMVFMDIKMPVMDGVETHRRIKEIRPDAVVMMMTAYTLDELVQQALQDGAYGIIYKPLDIEKVVAIIEESRRSTRGALIFVVDDDPGTCNTLKNILIKRGHEVCTTHTGEEAIDMAQEKVPDIIFIDMKLPTINGLETYLAIREVNPRAVAVMITGYREEMNDLVNEAIRSGAYTCLYKPIDIQEMLRMIEEIWQRTRKTGLLV